MNFFLFLFYVAFPVCIDCRKGLPRIGLGFEVQDSEKFPFFAQLRVDKGNVIGRCGATLISPDWILTACHCFPKGQRPSTVGVSMGSTTANSTKNGEKNRLEQIQCHPNYTYDPHAGYDVALGKLAHPYTISKTINTSILATDSAACARGFVMGGGLTEKGDKKMSRVLKYAKMSRKANKPYSRMWVALPDSQFLVLGQSVPQAGYEDYGYGLPGDSGGPFFCSIKSQYVQLGVLVSYAFIPRVSRYGKWLAPTCGIESVDQYYGFIKKWVPDANFINSEGPKKRIIKKTAMVISGIDTRKRMLLFYVIITLVSFTNIA